MTKLSRIVLLASGMLTASHALAADQDFPMNAAINAESVAFGELGSSRHVNRTIDIHTTDRAFMPDKIAVARGDTIRFRVANAGTLKHEFVIGDAALHARHEKEMESMPDMKMDEANAIVVAPGQTGILIWHFSRSGDFTYACDIPGHAEAGMTGTIHVR